MAGSGDVMGIATSGLLAFQRSMATTSHNIANVNTPGYSRQTLEISPQDPQASGSGFIGSGVKVDTVQRSYNEFLTRQVRSSTSAAVRMQVFHDEASRLADLLGDPDAGLGAGMDTFFNAFQEVANDPSSIPARQVLFTESESLISRFHYLDDQLSETRFNVDVQLGNLVNDVNTFTEEIASHNKAILVATGKSGGQPPNDLLDARDRLLEQLAQLVTVKTVEQDDGSLNVFVGNGQALVTGLQSAKLSMEEGEFGRYELDIFYNTSSSQVRVTDNLSGGKLGGLLDVRANVLDPARNALGRIAAALSTEVNQQHALGMDLEGDTGNLFFNDVSTRLASAATRNTGDIDIGISITDVSQLTTSDYRLDYDGANYMLTRMSDGVVFPPSATLPIDLTTEEGFTLSVASGTTSVAGDSYLIRPTGGLASSINMVLADVRDIAAAAPVAISESKDSNGLPRNSGHAGFGNVVVQDTSSLPLTIGVTFTYNDTLKQFSYAGDVSGTFAYDPAVNSGSTFSVAGISFEVTGTPDNGDQFVMLNNLNGVGDNRNALLLSGLQSMLSMEEGTTHFQGAYGQLIAEVGTQTRQAELGRGAQENLLRIATEQRDSATGVNLDEEAANLLRFQQAYQALAQVIATADLMFNTLIGAVRN